LKSNENFLRLQDELAGTENRIAVERKRYNDTCRIKHLRAAIPAQYFRGLGGVQAERRLLRLIRRLTASTQSGFLESRCGNSATESADGSGTLKVAIGGLLACPSPLSR
jgi:LemA family